MKDAYKAIEFNLVDLMHFRNYLRYALTYVREQLDRETSVEMAELEREELKLINDYYVRISNYTDTFMFD